MVGTFFPTHKPVSFTKRTTLNPASLVQKQQLFCEIPCVKHISFRDRLFPKIVLSLPPPQISKEKGLSRATPERVHKAGAIQGLIMAEDFESWNIYKRKPSQYCFCFPSHQREGFKNQKIHHNVSRQVKLFLKKKANCEFKKKNSLSDYYLLVNHKISSKKTDRVNKTKRIRLSSQHLTPAFHSSLSPTHFTRDAFIARPKRENTNRTTPTRTSRAKAQTDKEEKTRATGSEKNTTQFVFVAPQPVHENDLDHDTTQ
ncbi:hypothetical protein NPIL_13241 [Nephila pilipes]|uniref:Uncharacterized protein n=1 Tax=Nephila pilipes TaxID=299642 RepID=A0A8X6P5I9_NEPPI|nr:hypothetical protein NPIL_13241 [Nephila pilipes]